MHADAAMHGLPGHQKRGGSTVQIHVARTMLAHVPGLALLGIVGGPAFARERPQAAMSTPGPAPLVEADQVSELDRLPVAGHHQGIQFATDRKRESTNCTDSISADGIGTFPGPGIAESLNRIPGLELARDANGEGVDISTRFDCPVRQRRVHVIRSGIHHVAWPAGHVPIAGFRKRVTSGPIRRDRDATAASGCGCHAGGRVAGLAIAVRDGVFRRAIDNRQPGRHE